METIRWTLTWDVFAPPTPLVDMQRLEPVDTFEVELPEIPVFNNHNEAFQWINHHGEANGYAVRKSQVSKYKGTTRNCSFLCSCEGEYTITHKYIEEVGRTRNKRTTTQRTNCGFNLYASCNKAGQWTVKPVQLTHNHPPAKVPGVFHQHRTLTQTEEEIIQAGCMAKNSPASTLAQIRLTASRENRTTNISIGNVYRGFC